MSATLSGLPGRQRLPSGRHHLPREAVLASQRGRMLDAMMSAASEKGYAAVTIADVVQGAGVSRRTFYEHFADKEACFLAAYDTGVEILLERMRDTVSVLGGDDWRAWTRASIESYLEALDARPHFAQSLHVEVFAAGPAAHARRAEIISLLAGEWRRLYERARRQDRSLGPAPSGWLLRTIVVGHEELVRERLRAGTGQSLQDLVDVATAIALCVLDANTGNETHA